MANPADQSIKCMEKKHQGCQGRIVYPPSIGKPSRPCECFCHGGTNV